MTAAHILAKLQALTPQEPIDWRGVRDEIHNAKRKATSEQEHVQLLAIHKAVMDRVERSLAGTMELAAFQTARAQDYNLLLTYETVVDGNVSGPLLDAVTEREVVAGRMAEGDEMRRLGVLGRSMAPPPPPLKSGAGGGLFGWIRRRRR